MSNVFLMMLTKHVETTIPIRQSLIIHQYYYSFKDLIDFVLLTFVGHAMCTKHLFTVIIIVIKSFMRHNIHVLFMYC